MSVEVLRALDVISREHGIDVAAGDILYINGSWYVTHSGLLRVARHNGCFGIDVRPAKELSDPSHLRWAFKAIVYRSPACKGFVGYGDADPTNVSAHVRGAELRIAETRAVNRALRKAYGIGICSVEELGSFTPPSEPAVEAKKPNSANGHHLRDRLLVLIRQHKLDSHLVKLYAAEFCGTREMREASREQMQQFVDHLSELAANNNAGLREKLSAFAEDSAGAA
ncbi:MAG: hypothetical protein ACJ71Q_21780 [Terriglobales bacterium]